jgi:hypothetical protein
MSLLILNRFFLVTGVMCLLHCVFCTARHTVYHQKASHFGNCSFSPVMGRSKDDSLNDEHAGCEIAKVLLMRTDMDSAVSFLRKVEMKDSVHKILIESVGMKDFEFGMLVDKFLTVASWWVIKKEVYNHRLHGNAKEVVHLIVLNRYNLNYEMGLRHLSAIQNPPTQQLCDETPTTILRMVDAGWGSQYGMYLMWQGQARFAVVNPWISVDNYANESMLFVHNDDCQLYPGLINKRECLLLPLTTCDMNKTPFANCHNPTRVVAGPNFYCFPQDCFQLANMSANCGSPILTLALGKKPVNDYQRKVEKDFDWRAIDVPSARFIDAGNNERTKPMRGSDVLSTFGLFYRPNFNLRRRTQIYLRELQESKHIPFQPDRTECVAIHIRRGDRNLVTDMPIKDYCDMIKKTGISRSNCSTEQLNAVPFPPGTTIWDCSFLSNFGCWLSIPFGGLTLIDYLERAKEVVPTARAAFIMTDDGPWLEESIAKLPESGSSVADWQVGVLSAHGKMARADPNGTRYTLDFFASIEVARQCEGFVGHWGSAVSQMVYTAMCFQYREHTAMCPPASDIGAELLAA